MVHLTLVQGLRRPFGWRASREKAHGHGEKTRATRYSSLSGKHTLVQLWSLTGSRYVIGLSKRQELWRKGRWSSGKPTRVKSETGSSSNSPDLQLLTHSFTPPPIQDDTDAINKAIAEKDECSGACYGSTTTGAIIYFPPGTYLIKSTIEVSYGMQVIGDVRSEPVKFQALPYLCTTNRGIRRPTTRRR